MPAGSHINDAVQDNNATWVTGVKKAGSSQYMFTYKIENNNGLATYKDSIINLKAAANRIAILNGGTADPDSSHIGITGFRNNKKNNFQPEDLSYITRIYIPHFYLFSEKIKYTKPVILSASLSQNIPNPFNNTTTINYSIPQQFSSAQIIITDQSGKVLKQININSVAKGSLNVDASTLPSGAYCYSLIVNGKLIDTKQMVLVK